MNRLIKNLLLSVVALSASTQAEIYFVHSDHLGVTQKLTDKNQKVVWEVESQTPFGELKINEDPDGDGEKVVYNLRFPGQYFDEETGLNYNYYRTYDPRLGRYIQSDPVGLAGGLNTYAYVNANPVMSTDPTGLIDTIRARVLAQLGRGNAQQLRNLDPLITNVELRTVVQNAITKLETPANQLIRGSLQRSRSYHSELAGKTYSEIIKLSRTGGKDVKRAAQQMKKLIEQEQRLMDKVRNCP